MITVTIMPTSTIEPITIPAIAPLERGGSLIVYVIKRPFDKSLTFCVVNMIDLLIEL